MSKLAVEELRGNVYRGTPPSAADVALQKAVLENSIQVVVAWCEESQAADTLPRLQKLKQSIVKSLPSWRRIFNSLASPKTAHNCFDFDTGLPCCHSVEETYDECKTAVENVMCPILQSGTDNPSEVKWFTAAVRLRGILLGIGTNSLLRRAWRLIFKKDLDEAVGKASEDDLADWSDQKAGTRKRHRKASVVAAVQYIFN